MARTTGDSTITQALIDEQNSAARVPHIRIFINSVDYTSRLLYLEHHEEAYRDRAVIGLSNRDNSLDSLDLDGQEFEIAYGYITGNNVAEPLGNGDTAEYVYTPTLWVKSHQIISIQGDRIYQIYAEGMWMSLREQKLMAAVNVWKANTVFTAGQIISPLTHNGHRFECIVGGTSSGSEPTWPLDGSTVVDNTVTWSDTGVGAPIGSLFNATHTVYGLIKIIIEQAMGWTLESSPPDDGIIDTFSPVFEINSMPFENAAALLYRLIWMTKGYLRLKKSKTVEFVYPQIGDSVDETYYSDKAHWFTEYTEKTILLIPNSVVVLCNLNPATGNWDGGYDLISGTDSDTDQIAKYREIVEPFLTGNIRNQTDADNRAAAILTKLKSEILGGRLVIPHDARVELYDRVSIQDNRGQ